ncbi:MAG: lysophospholipid transporter LplT [Methyloversatilis sp.]|nr:lysophospholipid transporter LplT [Methyloversatilis sp.]MBP6193279.1 lysophospholipid transporter LplT [Methyloversatilis sp.]MBP9117238.1 lysophospholipid transporter LplT [Methyloversatilis sp.]
MPFGFYMIMAAQFFSALADNALLVVAIFVLKDALAPDWQIPLLKLFFTISYVALAAFVGALADSMAKRRVMLIGNGIKVVGCALMFAHVHPLLAYAVVGLGAASYSPAKYGILTEYLPHRLLVVANGWIEGLTVGAIILGVLMGGLLIDPSLSARLLAIDLPMMDTGLDTTVEISLAIVGSLYVLAGFFNLFIPDTGVPLKPLHSSPLALLADFSHSFTGLWKDKLGQISLAVTTLFWGAGATLQFIVIDWADRALGMGLSQASKLQGVVAVGIAIGAIMAARRITLRGSVRVIPLGIAMGLLVPLMVLVSSLWLAVPLLVMIGACAGFFVVPMNALLQHRGHMLMGAGHSIAVQNFNENLSILIMTGLYAALLAWGLSVFTVMIMFGLFIAVTMYMVGKWHKANQRKRDDVALLEDGFNH